MDDCINEVGGGGGCCVDDCINEVCVGGGAAVWMTV